MKKTFKQCSDQLERIYRLYLHGFGTKNLLSKAEHFMCKKNKRWAVLLVRQVLTSKNKKIMKTKVIYLSSDCDYPIEEFERLTHEEKLHVAKNDNQMYVDTIENFQRAFNLGEISDEGFIYFI